MPMLLHAPHPNLPRRAHAPFCAPMRRTLPLTYRADRVNCPGCLTLIRAREASRRVAAALPEPPESYRLAFGAGR